MTPESKREPSVDVKIAWTQISQPGAVLTVRTAPIPDIVQRRIERALDKGPAAASEPPIPPGPKAE